MPQIITDKRNQLQLLELNSHIDKDNPVCIIDAFCNSFNPVDLGFHVKGLSHEGRPAFTADTLIRLYIYGYLNGVRSSRKLEAECKRNIELWWLIHQQQPNYKTIADFRKDNQEAFYNLFVLFRDFCLQQGLYGKKRIAIDGSKFRAQNSRKNNYNIKKINQHLEYIENQTKDYLDELGINDKEEIKSLSKKEKKPLKTLKNRKKKYTKLKKKLEKSEDTQISTTDPDARKLPLRMKIVEVAYNVQSSVDDKNNLIVDFHVTNQTDHNALAPLAIDSKEAFELDENEELIVLADKGYYNGKQMHECHENNIDTLVSPKKNNNPGKATHVRKDKFKYDTSLDQYVCPKGKPLHHQGRFKRKNRNGEIVNYFDRYIASYSDCCQCPFFEDCVNASSRSNKRGRYIDRSEFDGALERNKEQVKKRKNEYRRRQAIVEHPFGTIKRQWGFTHTLMKGLENVDTEFSLIMLAYNFKRTMSIMGKKKMRKALKGLNLSILSVTTVFVHDITTLLKRYKMEVEFYHSKLNIGLRG